MANYIETYRGFTYDHEESASQRTSWPPSKPRSSGCHPSAGHRLVVEPWALRGNAFGRSHMFESEHLLPHQPSKATRDNKTRRCLMHSQGLLRFRDHIALWISAEPAVAKDLNLLQNFFPDRAKILSPSGVVGWCIVGNASPDQRKGW